MKCHAADMMNTASMRFPFGSTVRDSGGCQRCGQQGFLTDCNCGRPSTVALANYTVWRWSMCQPNPQPPIYMHFALRALYHLKISAGIKFSVERAMSIVADSINPSFALLKAAFLAMEPANCFMALARQTGGGSLTEDVQNFILELCVQNFVLNDTSGNHTHVRNFLKKVIYAVELVRDTVVEGLYEQFAKMSFPQLLHEGQPVAVAFTIKCPFTKHFDSMLEEAAAEFYPNIRFVRAGEPRAGPRQLGRRASREPARIRQAGGQAEKSRPASTRQAGEPAGTRTSARLRGRRVAGAGAYPPRGLASWLELSYVYETHFGLRIVKQKGGVTHWLRRESALRSSRCAVGPPCCIRGSFSNPKSPVE
ncbi:hypothetical protein KSP39_PZI001624 [Platanthera zijinensis]|uniref:Uncharacterized protein n=1 Tax=Platanthera zijinensis TaxID=2320716 RepID=A0AAP0GED5_9ASPA